MNIKLNKVLFSADEIKHKVINELAVEASLLAKDTEKPLFICVLNGAVHFFSDLTRNMYLPTEYAFIRAKSYVGTQSMGAVKLDLDQGEGYLHVGGRDVFLIEDIVDTGITMQIVKNTLLDRGAKDVKIISLLNKPARRSVKDLKLDLVGWEIPDEFVVGYGLDYDGEYRNLPYIGVVKEGTWNEKN